MNDVLSEIGDRLIPSDRPSTEEVFGSIEADYKLVLNLLALAIFVVLFALRPAKQPGPRRAEPS